MKKSVHIYLFCNFSENFNCKGNVKSMYSDYPYGIAFLIKLFNPTEKGATADRFVLSTVVVVGSL